MTLVGPRPVSEWEIRHLANDDKYREFRLFLQPGITGIWPLENLESRRYFRLHVYQRLKSHAAYDEILEILRREQEALPKYLRTRSFAVDTEILFLPS